MNPSLPSYTPTAQPQQLEIWASFNAAFRKRHEKSPSKRFVWLESQRSWRSIWTARHSGSSAVNDTFKRALAAPLPLA